MITNEFKPKQALQIARIIYSSMIAGLLIFLAAAFYVADENYYFKPDLTDPFIITIIVLSCTTLPAGLFLSKMYAENPDFVGTLQNKFHKYQIRLIIRMSTSEGVGLFAIVCFLLKSNLVFVIFLFIALSIMLKYYPTPEKIGRELNLTQSEIESFTQF
jgi:hypothetical protein